MGRMKLSLLCGQGEGAGLRGRPKQPQGQGRWHACGWKSPSFVLCLTGTSRGGPGAGGPEGSRSVCQHRYGCSCFVSWKLGCTWGRRGRRLRQQQSGASTISSPRHGEGAAVGVEEGSSEMARRRPAFQVPDRTSCRKVTLCSLQAPRSEGGVQAGSLCVAPEAAAEGAETRRPRDRARRAACTQDNTVTLQPAVPTGHPAATRAGERLLGPCRGGAREQQAAALRAPAAGGGQLHA